MDVSLKEDLARLMFRFRKVVTSFFSELDINITELVIMKRIAESVFCDREFSISDIHHNLFITKPAVSQMLNSLEKKGYITREINTNDRRKIVLALTPKGLEIMDSMRKDADNMMYYIILRYGEENIKQLMEQFNHFADVFEEIKNEVPKYTKSGK